MPVEAETKMLRVLIGVVLGVLLVPVAVLMWFWFGKVPVAVADPPIPHEREVLSIPIHARIHREMIKNPPIVIDEGNLVAGAHVYSEKCATCHGFHGKPSAYGSHMFPVAPQLWQKHPKSDVVGVSDDPPGETYWKVANGIRLTGMPAYSSLLTQTEMWQVSLLLANADKPLPPQAIELLRNAAPIVAQPPSPAAPAPYK
jgi:mono/diheme cytochrome c family protein